MTAPTITTTPNDPGLDRRILAAILERVAFGESVPQATQAVSLGAIEEARTEGLGDGEMRFIAAHVCRLGSGLMSGLGDLAQRSGLIPA